MSKNIIFRLLVGILIFSNVQPVLSAAGITNQEPTATLAATDAVPFADQALAECVAEQTATGDTTVADVEALTSLYCSSRAISDLTGLEYATELIELDLSFNEFSDLSPLANSTNLVYVYLDYNQLTDANIVENWPDLNSFYADYNNITDLTPFRSVTGLEYLSLSYNGITDVTGIEALESPRTFIFDGNHIEHLSTFNLEALRGTFNEVSLRDQTIYLDDITVYSDDEVFYDFINVSGAVIPFSLGAPTEGTNQLSVTFNQGGDDFLVGRIMYYGTVYQNVTYENAILTGKTEAKVNEHTPLTEQMLIDLFAIESNAGQNITVDYSQVEIGIPWNYEVTFMDEYGNTVVGTLTVVDVLPTLEIDLTEVTIELGATIDDILSQLSITGTELAVGDLSQSLIINDSQVDYNKPGSYTLVIGISDDEGNHVTKEITVNVKEQETPSEVTEEKPTNDNKVTLTTTGGIRMTTIVMLGLFTLWLIIIKRRIMD